VAVRRLPIYLRALHELLDEDVQIVSSHELAERTGLSPEQIRKDLAYFGAFGRRGVGYETRILASAIRDILGLNRELRVALVGAGNLGTALARYTADRHHGVRVVAIFDSDPHKVGTRIAGVVVQPLDQMVDTLRQRQIRMAIVAVPATQAQRVIDMLAEAGVQGVLNFAPTKVRAPRGMRIHHVDLTLELQSLAFWVTAEGEVSGSSSGGEPSSRQVRQCRAEKEYPPRQ